MNPVAERLRDNLAAVATVAADPLHVPVDVIAVGADEVGTEGSAAREQHGTVLW